jgi:hypothetical protein
MGTRKVGFLVLAALATAAFACSPLSNAISSTAGTAVSAAAATAGAASDQGGTGGSSGASPTVSAAGNVALPTDTVPYEKGKVYEVGQAVKDDKTGVIFLVDNVKFDSSLAGLSSGESWALITITLGNAGATSYSTSSIINMWIKSSGTGQQYAPSLSAILSSHVVSTDAPLDQPVDPGKAVQGILPIIVPDTATGLVLYFSPQGSLPPVPVFVVSLGK